MTPALLTVALSLASAVIGSLITGLYAVRSKRVEYLHDFNRLILQRRIGAYEKLEKLIVALKSSVLDSDRKPYHLLFSNDEDWLSAYKLTGDIANDALWLSDEAFDTSQKLNYLMFQDRREGGAISFGKRHYEEIARLREDMERVLATDMLSLPKVDAFLQRKSRKAPQGLVSFKSTEAHGLRPVGGATKGNS